MKWAPNVWAQIKNVTCDDLISALERDGWVRDVKSGAAQVFYDQVRKRRVVIHYHPQKSYRSPSLLKNLIADIGWSEEDLRRLKLIK